MRRRLLPLLLPALALAGLAAPARAYHTAEERLVEETAYTLRFAEAKIGFFRWDFGVLPRIQVGTIPLFWLARVPNLSLKSDVLRMGPVTVAGKVSLATFTADKGEAELRATLVPLEGAVSWRISETFTGSGEVVYTKVGVSGGRDTAESNDLRGAVAVTNFQVAGTLEWRLSEVTAFLVHGRWLAWQEASGAGDVTFSPDAYTTVEAHLAGKSDVADVSGAWSVVPSFHWSWDRWNLRLGLGYGNWSLPVVHMVVPVKTVIPELDLYWRF